MADISSKKGVFGAVIILGIASIGLGCYCLIQAFNTFDISPDFQVWFARAATAIGLGLVGLNIGGNRIGLD
ncbi:hypothetical protein LFL96_22365 [Paraburkholderia sp. D15]|uniref:hypothetical protein n=1 Tax=Paraburkholderia sp. D15 TaxID=2880218 RepID=UPI00247A8196|nr:hypothetical protein [Paraburkholderia sp. D15]WGS53793.1 hypothetical protein LFL96_22365 [Paraburkholderia sp. D15]